MPISHLNSSWTPGVFCTCFYNHARRLRLEKRCRWAGVPRAKAGGPGVSRMPLAVTMRTAVSDSSRYVGLYLIIKHFIRSASWKAKQARRAAAARERASLAFVLWSSHAMRFAGAPSVLRVLPSPTLYCSVSMYAHPWYSARLSAARWGVHPPAARRGLRCPLVARHTLVNI